MFCKQCGQKLEEGVRFCGNCGTQVGQVPEQTYEQFPQQTADVRNNKSKKKWIIALCVAAVCIAVGLVLYFTLRGDDINKSPESVAENFIIADATCDAERLLKCLPDFAIREIEGNFGMRGASRKQLIKAMESNIEPEDRRTCQILEIYRDYDQDLLEEYMDELEYELSRAELSRIEDGCLVVVESLKNGEHYKNLVVCAKYSGKWYVIDGD